MPNISQPVKEILDEFTSKEAEYIYAPLEIRDLFTLSQKEEWIRSDQTMEQYIQKNNLREIAQKKKDLELENRKKEELARRENMKIDRINSIREEYYYNLYNGYDEDYYLNDDEDGYSDYYSDYYSDENESDYE